MMDRKKLKASTVLQLFSDCGCERNNRTQMKMLKKKWDVYKIQLHVAAIGVAASVAIKKNTGVGHFHITFHLFLYSLW